MLAHFLAPFWFQIVIVFVLLLVVTGLTLLLPYLVQRAVDGPITSGNINGLIPYGIAYFVTIVAAVRRRASGIPTCCKRSGRTRW